MEERHFHRRNLPHLYYNDGIYFITYRLNNSIPAHLLEPILAEYHSQDRNRQLDRDKYYKLFIKYDKLLDLDCLNIPYLRRPEIADIVKRSLHFYDKKDYNLFCYCIMPNHVHLVFELREGNRGISNIMHSIKRFSARECNKLLNQMGTFWLHESYDRLIRDEKELYHTVNYVINNPVAASLVEKPEDWEYSYLDPGFI